MVSVFKGAQTNAVALREQIKDDCFFKKGDQRHHCATFDQLQFNQLAHCALDSLTDIQQKVAAVWEEHAETLSSLLEKVVPTKWVEEKEILLSADSGARSLVNMPKEVFQKIGPLTNEARSMCKVRKQAPFLSQEITKRLNSLVTTGIESVVFTIAIIYIRREIPTYLSAGKVENAIDAVKKKFNQHGVQMTEEISDALSKLQSGEVTTEEYALKDRAAAAPTPATAASTPVAPPAEAPVAPPPAPAPSTPVAASSAETPVAPPRARLANRYRDKRLSMDHS